MRRRPQGPGGQNHTGRRPQGPGGQNHTGRRPQGPGGQNHTGRRRATDPNGDLDPNATRSQHPATGRGEEGTSGVLSPES